MAAPKQVYDNELSEKPVTKPDLKTQSPDELKKAEANSGTTSGDSGAESENLEKLEKKSGGDDKISYSEERSPLNFLRGKSKKKKIALLVGGGAGFGLFALVIVFIIFIGSFKAVHFSTVLRSVGFARFQMYMRQQFAQTTFDAAVLTDESTGSAKL